MIFPFPLHTLIFFPSRFDIPPPNPEMEGNKELYTTLDSDRTITEEEMYLIDSGAQYKAQIMYRRSVGNEMRKPNA